MKSLINVSQLHGFGIQEERSQHPASTALTSPGASSPTGDSNAAHVANAVLPSPIAGLLSREQLDDDDDAAAAEAAMLNSLCPCVVQKVVKIVWLEGVDDRGVCVGRGEGWKTLWTAEAAVVATWTADRREVA